MMVTQLWFHKHLILLYVFCLIASYQMCYIYDRNMYQKFPLFFYFQNAISHLDYLMVSLGLCGKQLCFSPFSGIYAGLSPSDIAPQQKWENTWGFLPPVRPKALCGWGRWGFTERL